MIIKCIVGVIVSVLIGALAVGSIIVAVPALAASVGAGHATFIFLVLSVVPIWLIGQVLSWAGFYGEEDACIKYIRGSD